MKRREFIALSAAPLAGQASNQRPPRDSLPSDDEILKQAEILKIEIYRDDEGLAEMFFELRGAFGSYSRKDFDSPADHRRYQAESLRFIHKLMTAFER